MSDDQMQHERYHEGRESEIDLQQEPLVEWKMPSMSRGDDLVH